MKTLHAFMGVALLFCLLALGSVPVSASLNKEEQNDWHAGGPCLSGILDNLTAQGYDVTEIQTAIDDGDDETARTLMQQFMEIHHGELPAPPTHQVRIIDQLDRLEQQSFDVSAIRTAIVAGDDETARTLMQQLVEEYKEELQPPQFDDEHQLPQIAESRITAHLANLTAQGYDVTEIQTSIDAGDLENARTLLEEFIKEHNLSKLGRKGPGEMCHEDMSVSK